MITAKYHGRCYTCCEAIIPGDTIGRRRARGGTVTECRTCSRRAAARVAENDERKRDAVAAGRRTDAGR